MFILVIENMKFTDRALIDHLKKQACDDQIHIIAPVIANQLGVGLSTIYRSLNRLMSHGYLERINGNNRLGFTYRIVKH